MDPEPSTARVLLARHRRTFRAVTLTVVPEAERLAESAWQAIEMIVVGALEPRPPALLRQLDLFIRLIDAAAFFRSGRRFHALDARRRTRVLASFETSPVLLLRRGFWGLRTLALMGYYARPEAALEIGYGADPRGWEVRA